MKCTNWKLNTSNPGKLEEFKKLFGGYGCTLEASYYDLMEIESDPASVVAHKASQLGENILVEDTSLEIEGASIGINIRWLLDHLSEYEGRHAQWTVLLAYRQGDQILIYSGVVSGIIVQARGSAGFGFDPVFLPDGTCHTLAEFKPDQFNARAKAVKALMEGVIWKTHPVIEKWEGAWQTGP